MSDRMRLTPEQSRHRADRDSHDPGPEHVRQEGVMDGRAADALAREVEIL